MGYYVIENFKLGLDSRNFNLSAPTGALVRAQNCHITAAGEIEKRKAFVLFCELPAGVFGLESTKSGLVAFGSGVEPTMPTGVGYIRCRHPGEESGGTDSAMTGVLCSGTFAGQAWCAARFDDGQVFGFYNGTAIPGFYNGIVFSGLTNTSDIAAQITDSLNRELVDAVTGTMDDYTVERSSNLVDIKAAVGGTFTLTLGESSTLGTLSQSQRSTGSSGTAGVGASCVLNFTTMGTDFSCTSITAPDGAGGTVNLLASSVGYSSSLSNTVLLIKNAINANITSPQYSATASGGSLSIFAPASLGDSANGGSVVLSYSGTLSGNTTGTVALTATASPVEISKTRGNTTGTVTITSPEASCSPSGGTPPYFYSWSATGFTVNSPSLATSTFSASVPIFDQVWGTAYCTVTDSGSPVQSYVSNGVGITLINEGNYQ